MALPLELQRQKDALRHQLEEAPKQLNDLEMLGHWGKYTCVLVAGFLENALRLQFMSYVSARTDAAVARHVSTNLDRVQNPKAEKFLSVAGSFDSALEARLRTFLDEQDGRRKQAINSIMTNRHLIAHGRTSTVSIVQVTQWFHLVCDVIDFIDTLLPARPN